jgi:ABC-type transporter Mla subunit MlaD
VWVGGKRVGTVSDVAFLPLRGDSLARVGATVQIPHSVRDQLRRDSRVRLTSARFIGEPVIDIAPGTAASPALAEGDTLFMDRIVTLTDLHGRVGIIAAAFDSARTELARLSPRAQRRMASLAPVLHNMQTARTEFAALMDGVQNGAAADFMANREFSEDLRSLQRSAGQLGPAFATARARLDSATTGGGASLEQLQRNAERLSAAINELQRMVATENGTLHRMTADSALLRSLHGVQAQLDSLIIEAKRNPLRFIL